MLNSSEPDPARHFVGPNLGPNCLKRLSADDTCRQRVKSGTNREALLVKKSFWYFIQVPRHLPARPWSVRSRIHRSRVQEPFYAFRSAELAYIILTDAQAFPKPGCHKIIIWLIRKFTPVWLIVNSRTNLRLFEPFNEQATR